MPQNELNQTKELDQITTNLLIAKYGYNPNQQSTIRPGTQYGDYPWDHWKQSALEAGLPASLAQLGRDLMREAYNHNWLQHLQRECGSYDEGKAMIQDALTDPEATQKRWNHLLETDGETIARDPETGEITYIG